MSATKRTLRFAQGMGWGVLTLGTGTATLFLATATCGLAMTGIGIPLAVITGAGTVGCGALTFLCGERTGHNLYKAFSHHHHHHQRTSDVYGQYLDAPAQGSQMKGLGKGIRKSQLEQIVIEMPESGKPLFVALKEKVNNTQPAMEVTSSIALA